MFFTAVASYLGYHITQLLSAQISFFWLVGTYAHYPLMSSWEFWISHFKCNICYPQKISQMSGVTSRQSQWIVSSQSMMLSEHAPLTSQTLTASKASHLPTQTVLSYPVGSLILPRSVTTSPSHIQTLLSLQQPRRVVTLRPLAWGLCKWIRILWLSNSRPPTCLTRSKKLNGVRWPQRQRYRFSSGTPGWCYNHTGLEIT